MSNAIDALKSFIAGVVGDSTDFQQTLNTFSTAVATANTAFDTALQNHPYSVKRTKMIADRNVVVTQQTLENSNITSLRTFTSTLADVDMLVADASIASGTPPQDLSVPAPDRSGHLPALWTRRQAAFPAFAQPPPTPPPESPRAPLYLYHIIILSHHLSRSLALISHHNPSLAPATPPAPPPSQPT